MLDIPANKRLIVALDYDSQKEALALVKKLGDLVGFYKVGWQLFMTSHFDIIEKLAEMEKRIFIDLKMGDIPATIQKALQNMPTKSAHFIELMTLSGLGATVTAARQGASSQDLKFLMLTVLSSMDESDIKGLYGDHADLKKIISFIAEKAINAGCNGLIASGDSVRQIREQFGADPIIVTPGIRPAGADVNDHKRAQTPQQAIINGADYLVVGRPITQADDVVAAAESIISEIQEGLDARAAANKSKPTGNQNSIQEPNSHFATAAG
ncbi:MAG TPA: orotidine-5'-phosphate decarboxylase [Gammaproteobacteria bacterium]|nr:orotidine-5'-phosphate decarboxylase [Gammaproteobacteria bacterium]